jgi:AraC-like DNA-binding protein
MSYREHAPPPGLALWLECTWERRGDGLPVRVLPDGCIDVIWGEDGETQLVGPNTTAFISDVRPGSRMIGARFRPGAAPALLGIAAEEFRDVRASVGDVWRGDGARLAETLDAHADPLHGLRRWIAQRARRADQPDAIVRATVQELRDQARAGRDLSIPRLAGQLAVSERQLRRRVVAAIGYGPKRLARVFRLYEALEAARAGEELARAAFDAGYADQAHFANECRALGGAPATVILSGWTERDRFLQDAPAATRDDGRHERS